MQQRRRIFPILTALIFASLFALVVFLANRGWQAGAVTSDVIGTEYETAFVVDILEDKTLPDPAIEGRLRGSKLLELEIRTGRYAGQSVEVPNYFSAMYAVDVKSGDTVSVRIDTDIRGNYTVSVYNYNRVPLILGMAALFCLALVLIGGWQGLRALLGLIFTFVCIVWILIPLVLQGWPPVPLTVVLVGITSAAGFFLLGGRQPKTLGALLGALCGIAAAAALGYLAAELIHISAYQMDEAEGLLLTRNDTGLRLSGLLLSGILIAAQGAMMDTAMSIASAMGELKEKKQDISFGELFRSGMIIGRDTTGTMANTLVLAFAGSSLNMMVLIFSYRVSFLQLMNTDFIAIEAVRALAGSLGIICTVPCTALITARLLSIKK
jgi:uncharacterized membrane protein